MGEVSDKEIGARDVIKERNMRRVVLVRRITRGVIIGCRIRGDGWEK